MTHTHAKNQDQRTVDSKDRPGVETNRQTEGNDCISLLPPRLMRSVNNLELWPSHAFDSNKLFS